MKFLYHADEKDSIEDYDKEYYDRYGMEHVSRLEGFTSEVIRTGKPILVHNRKYFRKDGKMNLKPLGTPSKVWLGVPLKLKNAVSGVLAVQSYSNAKLYGDKEKKILIAVAGQIALAIDHKKSAELQKRNEEIRKTLFSIANAVNITLNLEALYRFIHITLSRVMDLPNFYIALYDKEKALVKFPYVVDEKDFSDQSEFVFDVRNLKVFSLTWMVIKTRKRLLINKKKIMQLCRKKRKQLRGTVPEVWFGVPLQVRNEVIGVMCAQSYSESFRFNEKDLEVLLSVSDQVAIAIDRKRADEEAKKRAERLMVINRIGNAAAKAHNLEKLMEAIYDEINLIFKPGSFFIAFLDSATNELEFRFLIDENKKWPLKRCPLGNGYSSKVIREKKPLIIRNYLEERNNLPRPIKLTTQTKAQSWIGVPLEFEDQIIGLVNIQSYQAHAWNEEDIQLFFTITDQIAGSIAKARLYEVVQQELNERKKAEEENKKLESQLRQAQKMEAIGTLAGGIAHDFNNVLYPIIGFTEMTMDLVPEESLAKKNLDEILIASDRAKSLVQQILTFSRQQEYNPQSLRVQPILKEALKLMRSSMPTTISIIQKIDETCGPVLSDPSQIHQIVMNLCTNAYHAMKTQGGILEVKLSEIDIPPGQAEKYGSLYPGFYLSLTVRDTGHGIDPLIMERIFDPYFTT
ncbi:MAG: GAF domain-containing protein, partial [Desulfobacteraceae bacterium]